MVHHYMVQDQLAILRIGIKRYRRGSNMRLGVRPGGDEWLSVPERTSEIRSAALRFVV